MNKGKFQNELVQRLGHVEMVHVTFNCTSKEMIPGPFNGSYLLDYDILFVDKQEGNETIQIQVKFQDPDHPFVTIEVLGKMIGFGYYAEEDPINIVWGQRVLQSQKSALSSLGLDNAIKVILGKINAAYSLSMP